MSKSAAPEAPCCPPMSQQRVDAGAAGAPGGEICVCELTPAFELSDSTISHHLKALKDAGLVDAERRASWVYYRARPDLMRRLAALLDPA
jgi:ArsR family transcriptional regulator